ncbi:MAG TPA: hypothetical protein DGG94_08920 [Micromonosporaceae bacterium]|nr:hypothetical protein [Micromonosporaceae bacterium]HCU49906.1 hypothetical protein [Micromonosporaceae bacterium]
MRTPVLPSAGSLSPLAEASITGGFWRDRSPETVIDHCLEWTAGTGWVANFQDGPKTGRVFADSEIYKVLEAMAWADHPGFLPLAQTVAGAQEPGGYLHTKFGRRGQPPRYSDLDWGHELYCYGHLIQAAVARLRAGFNDALTTTAMAVADHVCVEFGPAGRQAYCGHPEIEMALVELYRATRERRYLDQAKLFVDRRGSQRLGDIAFGRAYFQDDVPVRARTAFSGHAVRELYLACGAVDVAVETADETLLAAIISQWEQTVARRTYLTGGMGSRHEGESFGEDFELPPDGAYAETCAGIASVMLAWRLLLATGQARFADLIERTLFNVVATSPARDGRSFFYANPLQWRAISAAGGLSTRAVTGQRAPWFDVSCCPTNIARTLASLECYLATGDQDGIQLHQYAPARLANGNVVLEVETDYPWEGRIRVRVLASPAQPWQLSLRVPAWASGATLDGQPVAPGYATLSRSWRPGEVVVLDLPTSPRWTRPDPRIDAVRGCVAVERGPLVYCLESPESVDLIAVDTQRPLAIEGADIVAQGHRLNVVIGQWPYGNLDAAAAQDVELRLIPYHRWANQGPSTMRVWLPLTTSA